MAITSNVPGTNNQRSRVGSGTSNKDNYQPEQRMRAIEKSIVALEKRIREIEGRFSKIQKITTDKKGKVHILVKK
jgi:predicted nucleotide-binding protein (sugar kinase/HSP70/actin superfamily)